MNEVHQAIGDYLSSKLANSFRLRGDLLATVPYLAIDDTAGHWYETIHLKGNEFVIVGHAPGGSYPEDDKVVDLNDPTSIDQIDSLLRKYYRQNAETQKPPRHI